MGIYDEEILGARQQEETARRLREGIKTPEGQMVSGWYVKPSITQYMAEGLKSYYAGKEGREARSKYEDTTKRKRDETARLLKQLEPRADVSITPEGMRQFTQQPDISTQGIVSNALNPQPQGQMTNTTYTQPDDQTRMAALLGLSQVNPEAAAPAIAMNQWQTGRQDKKDAAAQAQQDFLERQHQAAQDRAAMVKTGQQPMAPVAYVNKKGETVWGTITEAKGHPAANYSPMVQGQVAGAKASGKETGQATGESQAKLEDLESMMPRLEVVVSELSDLGKKATYTMAGQATDFTRRQLGMYVGEGAIARKEYISKVDNEILPLLRQTFGAQFTQKEGESLKATLGDPNASPEEKDAVLKSFIQTKYGQIAALQRRTAGQPAAVGGDVHSEADKILGLP